MSTQRHTALEEALASVESCLAAIGNAFRERDTAAIDHHAQALQGMLAAVMQRALAASRQPDSLPAPLRRRLAAASAQIAVQRATLARANAALARAMDVLMPADAAPYAADGARARPVSTGAIGA
jgi:hypothetical protein